MNLWKELAIVVGIAFMAAFACYVALYIFCTLHE